MKKINQNNDNTFAVCLNQTASCYGQWIEFAEEQNASFLAFHASPVFTKKHFHLKTKTTECKFAKTLKGQTSNLFSPSMSCSLFI